VSNSLVQKINMSRARELVGNLAQTNYYLIDIPLPPQLKKHFSDSYPDLGNIDVFIKEKLGYLCSEATLPTSSYATAEVKDNYMGVTQEFAHTRLYTDMDLTFYVDADYSILRFFEGWMDYIGGGNIRGVEPAAASILNGNIYRRFNFPNFYKIQNMSILKFERDYDKVLEYIFVNVFPKGVTSIPVSYGPADLLKVTVSFNYDRYVVKRTNITKDNIPPDIAKELSKLTTEDQFSLAIGQETILRLDNIIGSFAASSGTGLENLNRANEEAFRRENPGVLTENTFVR
jgi:hypothetical protein